MRRECDALRLELFGYSAAPSPSKELRGGYYSSDSMPSSTDSEENSISDSMPSMTDESNAADDEGAYSPTSGGSYWRGNTSGAWRSAAAHHSIESAHQLMRNTSERRWQHEHHPGAHEVFRGRKRSLLV